MQNKMLNTLYILCLLTFMSCSQNNTAVKNNKVVKPIEKVNKKTQEPHRYGGYYCPDNLNGFPAVDIINWKSVPVVNGRMATKEETQNGTSLIFVNYEKYEVGTNAILGKKVVSHRLEEYIIDTSGKIVKYLYNTRKCSLSKLKEKNIPCFESKFIAPHMVAVKKEDGKWDIHEF